MLIKTKRMLMKRFPQKLLQELLLMLLKHLLELLQSLHYKLT